MLQRSVLISLICALVPGCGSFCEAYPEACGEPRGGGGGIGNDGGAGGASSDGGAGGAAPTCDPPCVAGDAATTAECVGGECQYTCATGFIDCDADPTTCETQSDDDGNCGGCGVDCAYDECTLIGEAYACNDPIDIDAGDDHTCAIKRDGSIWCWGRNNLGQLGSVTGAAYSVLPQPIDSLPATFRAATQSQGRNYGCAQAADGAFACWPKPPSTSAQAQVMTGAGVDSIAAFDLSERDAEVLTIMSPDQTLRQFIYNFSTTALVLDPLTPGTAEMVSTSGQHRCVIFTGGVLKCWGADDMGQIGNGASTSTTVSSPFELMPGTEFIGVGTGEKHTCALGANGTIYCTGRNGSGYVGNTNNPVDNLVPFLFLPPFTALVVGVRTNAAFTGSDLYLFGDNDSNQMKASSGDAVVPTLYSFQGDDVAVDVALGMSHTCVLFESGLVKCWGNNSTGQLGNGGTAPSSSPVTTVL